MRRWTFLIVLLLLSLPASGSAACQRFYVIVFGSQNVPTDPDQAHTFAVFVKVVQNGNACTICPRTISWLPATGNVHWLKMRPEPGRLYGLHETMAFAFEKGQRVSAWGPYEIDRDLYCRAVRQLEIFESGQVQYKALDSLFPNFMVCNCIHAVEGTAGLNRPRLFVPSWGETASYWVTLRFRRWMKNPHCRHPWLAGALGLDQYPIIYRPMQPPRTGAVWSWINKRFGVR